MREEIVKSPSVAFLLHGKRKTWFSLSLHKPAGQPVWTPSRAGFSPRAMDGPSQINSLQNKPLICAPVHRRVDDFFKNHHE
ncbi:MAG: hypothetical protein BMS9Abin18_0831 [Zetaproteobacteria bacterium]|nr:MAG: hypothetical protein BMS9Abin18_0831 [Zetaproteobacteria bacterium]